ncbi:MAG: flagellar protein FlgN [Pseudobutyrivibrio sp.]|nr:flagellar protein FlgN [Pseudobutyrivibrio sp.]
MASLLDDLLATMDGETEQYKRLISLNDKKKDSIIYQKLSELEVVTAEEQQIAEALGSLEKKRLTLLNNIAVVLGHGGEEITVSWMIDNLSNQPEERDRLIAAKDALVEAANTMQICNIQNQALLSQALEMVEYDITLMKSMKQAPQTANYGKDAMNTGDLLSMQRFDAKQ